MLQIAVLRDRRVRCDPRAPDSPTKADPIVRAVQIGLLIYLSPVILAVSGIGATALAVHHVTRLVGKAWSRKGRRPAPKADMAATR